MKVNLYLVLKDAATGELEGFITSNGENHIVLDSRMVALDFLSNSEKLTPDIHAKYYFSDGELVPIPVRPSEFHDFNYTLKQWVKSPQSAWASVRQQRARLLAGSDWMVTKAAESGQTVPPEWVAYRQALRDITLQTDPWAIVWPVVPI